MKRFCYVERQISHDFGQKYIWNEFQEMNGYGSIYELLLCLGEHESKLHELNQDLRVREGMWNVCLHTRESIISVICSTQKDVSLTRKQ